VEVNEHVLVEVLVAVIAVEAFGVVFLGQLARVEDAMSDQLLLGPAY
jgi:hypothetical protein